MRDGIEVCIDDELPFEIPDSWAWTRLGDIGDTNIGLTYSPSYIAKTGVAVLRSNNIKDGKINYDELVHVNVDVPARAFAKTGDILICARNGSRKLVGKTATIERDGIAFGAFMAIFRSQLNPFIKVFLDSSAFRVQFDGVETTTINQVTQNMLKSTLIALPPIAEQYRIVDRVEQLLTITEKL
ncbi:MAG: restriction endonuclease subunit S [Oscillospiraceae bacterium]|jgi:type I restriction enzyme S subunit|nr:restriction endonuclease subunit S [Oscillospiraceae bacterium]